MGYVDVGEEEYWGAERGDAEEDEEDPLQPDAKRQKTGKQEKGACIFQDGHQVSVSHQAWQLIADKEVGLSTFLQCREQEESSQGLQGSQAEHQQDVHSGCQ